MKKLFTELQTEVLLATEASEVAAKLSESLEVQNQQLKDELAKLRAENTRLRSASVQFARDVPASLVGPQSSVHRCYS